MYVCFLASAVISLAFNLLTIVLSPLLAAEDAEVLASIDIEAGWPS